MTTEEHIKTLTKEFRPTSQKIDLYDWNIQDTSTRVFKIKDKEGNKFKLFAFTDRVRIESPVKTSLLFSLNLPDNICLANKLLNSSSVNNKIYTDHSNDKSILVCLDLINQDLKDLRLESNEGLFVYGNVIELLINKTRPLLPELLTIQKIRSKIENNFPDNFETINASKIPSNLQDLIPMLREWAISDDLERDEKINQSSKAELKNVIDLVNSKMNLINNYLDSFKSEPMTYEATLIGSLAELVTELTLKK